MVKRLLFFVIAFIYLISGAGVGLALSAIDKQSIYNDTVWYDPSSSAINDSFCLGGPGGSGPLYGPNFPQVSDTAAFSTAIKNYISDTFPTSPLASLSDTYVGYGQQHNVNPAFIVAITQKETGLGTTGYGREPKYNVGNIRGGDDGTGFKSYPSLDIGLEAIYRNLDDPAYLQAPTSFTTISQIMNRYAPPSDNNDTPGYIQFIGEVMQKIFSGLTNLPTDAATSSCSNGALSGDGVVNSSDTVSMAQALLNYQKTGQYHCDNQQDCTDLQKIIDGQSLAGSEGCQAETLDPRVLRLLLYIISNGYKVGTYALCGDHEFDSSRGHSGGYAVDISSVNGASLGQNTQAAASEGLKLDLFLNNLPAELKVRQQISYGYGQTVYSSAMAATQQYNGSLCGSRCEAIYTLAVENQHKNHIHVGY